jgi:two-component system chemotaxis response regulator CheB
MPFRLLIVDDSPLYRLRLSQILSASDRLQLVGLAGDGREAIRLIKERRAQVIVLDLEMPELDGFSVLRWAMAHAPLPIVVCSGQSERENVFRALEAGAVDFITKPELRHAVRSEAFAVELRQRVEAAAEAHAYVPVAPRRAEDSSSLLDATRLTDGRERRARLVAVVGSAGGPAAVTRLVSELRPCFGAPVVVALHMPQGFTRSFAERLSRTTPFSVREAHDGEALQGSRVYIAPGGQHTTLRARDGELSFRVEAATPEDFCAPSADRLLQSAAEACGPEALGVVLTGMGEDGKEGARALSERGGLIVVESRESAVIWGMPRAVAEAGLADAELDLQAIAAALPLLCGKW